MTRTDVDTGKTAIVDGVPLHYHEAGEGDTIFFLHSYNFGTTAWINFHKNFFPLSTQFHCVMMDLVNFGRSGPFIFEEYVHTMHARFALALMDELGLEKVNIVGNSVGGSAALALAALNPNRVKQLVVGGCHLPAAGLLADPFGNAPPEGARSNAAVIADPTRENIRRSLLVHIDDGSLVDDELVEYYYQDVAQNAERVAASARSRGTGGAPLLTEIANLSHPTLIIHGRYDRMVPVDYAVTMMNVIPNSRLMILNHCGHLPPFEFPDEYNSLVSRFFTDFTEIALLDVDAIRARRRGPRSY